MRRLYTIILLCALCSVMNAQYMNIYKGDTLLQSLSSADFDSVTFSLTRQYGVIQSFSFLKSDNEGKVIEDLTVSIVDDTISIETPFILDASSLVASFETDGGTVYVNDVQQISGETMNDFTIPVTYRVLSHNGYNKEYVVKVICSGLPVLYIDTPDAAAITSKDEWMQNTSLRLVDADGTEVSLTTSIKGRGNSTWNHPKKPYALKLDKKSGFLGMAKGKRWCLLANYSDKTSLRNELAFAMSRDSKLAWTPDTRFVELVLNGTHQGLYQLCEQIKIDENRVNVGDDGFILEVDQLDRMTDEDVYFQTSRCLFNIKDPDTEKDSESYNLIKDYVTDTENILYGADFLDPDSGYKQKVDINSFVDWYLINEIAHNHDSAFLTSCYMNKTKEGKLNMGPVWDFDLGFGNVNYADCWLTGGLWVYTGAWIHKMFDDPAFVSLVKERFQYFYDNKDKYIDAIVADSRMLDRSVKLNDNIWHTMNVWVWPNYVVMGSYKGEIEYLTTWLSERFEYMKTAFGAM